MKKVIIIGGGVAGLAAGIYLRANGYDVSVIEKNATVGGACIGWERSGCYIDGCIHWLAGVNPKTQMHKLWRDTHAIKDDTEIFYQDELTKYKFTDGSALELWADVDKLEKSLIKFAPEDKRQIKKLTALIRKFQRVDPPSNKPVELMNIFELLKIAFTMLGVYIRIIKTSAISCKILSKKFKNDKLRDVIEHFMAPNYNFMSMLYMLGHISGKDGGIPVGGSLDMVKRMERRFLDLGGNLILRTSVQKIIVENNVATGVMLKDGQTLNADWVVSTVPVEHCLSELLENKYPDKTFDFRLKDPKTYPIYTYTTVVFKCPETVKEKFLSVNVSLDKPIKLNTDFNRVVFRNYCYDQTLKRTDGYFVVQATIHDNDSMYFWWKDKKENGTYKQEKARIAKEVLEIAKTVYPDSASALEVIDVVTPMTYERYLNSRHGGFQGFIHTNTGKSLMHKGRIKGLKNFILAGQWIIRSGGLPPAVMSGRFAAQRICHTDKKKFVNPTY